MKPITKYVKSGDVNIAYQVFGTGSIDLIYIPGWVSNIDMLWIDPKISNFLIKLTKFARLVLFDKRGTGLSDRVSPTCTLEKRMDDIRSVMDAIGIEKAILFGHSEGGTVATLFAATYPNRTIALINFGVFAKRKYSDDYPWAPKPEDRENFYNLIRKEWGNGQKMGLEWIMPSLVKDTKYYNWFASYLRSSASPGAALALAQMNTEADVTHVLNRIKVPTLVLHRTDDRDVNIEEGKYLANHIPNAKFVELDGIDHLFWVGDTFSVIAEIEEFITGSRPDKLINGVKQEFDVNIQSKNPKISIEKTMQENFQYDLKIEGFAQLCGRSISAFKRDFKKIYKITPARWIMAKRLEYAKSLLLSTDLNINQICYESGFQNNSHFIKSFKEKFKSSPYRFKSKSIKIINHSALD
jgi:pimeloyl-ACP methyl ester carboxylesterase/AraC-like DNA-binding protein